MLSETAVGGRRTATVPTVAANSLCSALTPQVAASSVAAAEVDGQLTESIVAEFAFRSLGISTPPDAIPIAIPPVVPCLVRLHEEEFSCLAF